MSILAWKTKKELNRKKETIFVGGKTWKLVVRKWEMLATSKVRISGSEKQIEQEHKQQNFGEHIRHFLQTMCN